MRSLRFRLIAWSTLLLMAGLGASSAIVYWGLSRALYAWVEPALKARASDAKHHLVVRDGRIMIRDADEEGDSDSSDEDMRQTVYSRVWNASGNVIRVSHPILHLPSVSVMSSFIPRAVKEGRIERTLGPIQVLLIRLPASGPPAGVLEVGASTSTLTHTLSLLRKLMLVVAPLILLIVIAGSWILISRALSPLDRLGKDAMAIETRNLSQGIGIPRTGDEVERLARVLDAMLKRLDAGFERERQFTADASHELRTPLAIIRGELDIAARANEPLTPETLAAVSYEVDRMRSLVHSLLDLSRSDAGGIRLHREPVRLDELANAVVEQSEPLAQEAGVSLRIERREPITVSGDEARLIQVALNLIDNAIRYTPRGGQVSVTVTAAPTAAKVPETGEAIFEVVDTGQGITAEQLPRVFERFYRADSSRTSRGTGLGLSIARAIAEAHKGRIDIESTPGKGTTARLVLPLIPV
ncbi:MAG TPA: HAMP domain-containing sensor histidine kinase [Armatimonadota bacterium]|nr:HAMP domain-containing sensor histidine kinase [Armatimonadota bacterium]